MKLGVYIPKTWGNETLLFMENEIQRFAEMENGICSNVAEMWLFQLCMPNWYSISVNNLCRSNIWPSHGIISMLALNVTERRLEPQSGQTKLVFCVSSCITKEQWQVGSESDQYIRLLFHYYILIKCVCLVQVEIIIHS